jgi:hypothetical protein
MLDAFWRAAAYCLYPRVMLLSVLPLLLIVALAWLWGYAYWDRAVTGVFEALERLSLLASFWHWLESMGLPNLKTALAPVLVIVGITPLLVMGSLLAVSVLMTPALTRLVAARRFPQMDKRHGGPLLLSLGWSALSLLLALGAMVLSLPLWLVPPMALLLPSLIWGWLTYRVMTFDVLAEHADAHERRALMAQHRLPLLLMGVCTGMMGAAPSLMWASGALFAAAFILLIPLAIWIYTLVFAFSSLWFAHYALTALAQMREHQTPVGTLDPEPSPTAPGHASERLDEAQPALEHRPPH